jgi:GMP reductase
MNKPPLYYDDICLIPDNYSELETRDNADTSVEFLGFNFKNPVIPANMSSVVDVDVCRKLAQDGYCYSMHRFGYVANGDSVTIDLIKTANAERWPLVSVSTGVGKDSYNDLTWMADGNNCHLNIDIITVDVALGFHKQVAEVIKFIKRELPHTKIIAGNIAGAKAAQFLIDAGADALKLGIGQGSVCSTKLQTGFTAPMLWSLQEIVPVADKHNIPIIADGGIKNIGDVAKALVFGAKMVMCGGLFAPCIDSAAKINNEGKKEYFGSASFHCKKHDKHVEGFMVGLEADKTIIEKMTEINQALASSISYAGGNNILDLNGIDYLVIR